MLKSQGKSKAIAITYSMRYKHSKRSMKLLFMLKVISYEEKNQWGSVRVLKSYQIQNQLTLQGTAFTKALKNGGWALENDHSQIATKYKTAKI